MMLLQVIIMTWVIGVILISQMAASAAVAAAPMAKPNCPDRCGDVEIPYPFGTSKGCYLDQNYFINCTNDSSGKTRRPMYENVFLLNISLEGHFEFSGYPASECYNKSGTLMDEMFYFVTTFGSISYTQNVFVAVGCDTIAYLNATQNDGTFSMGCMSVCQDTNDVANGSCSGIGCCQVEIPKGLRNFSFQARSFSRHKGVWKFNPCSYAFVVKKDTFRFSTKYLHGLDMDDSTFPIMVMDWGIRDETCEFARAKSDILCGENSTCYDPDNGYGYRCRCNPGYGGNPYLPDGCQDINECQSGNNCMHPELCKNTMGNYTCSCTKWYRGDGRKDGTGCDVNLPLLIKMVVGIGTALLMLLVGCFGVYWGLKRRNLIKLKGKFFQQNGGLMLQQRLSNHQGSMEPVRIFNAKELEKATNNYDKSRILGQGGNGTVYRGVLIENIVVAIKRSKIADQNQIEQFINEVIVLTQTNHRNVVKLLGCCLETEVPLLVYEFITNGTLSDHLHDKNKSSLLSWEKRLKIATEAAGALAYLHFETSIPIIHRDVKTANILLDDNHTAKVADFGASRLIPLDHTRLTTLVQGTFGYLDPEYLCSGQLTEKSDVYSFGVVLAELLTGEKAISLDRAESEKNLSTYFISALKDGRLLEIIEGNIIKEGNVEEVKEVSCIAKRCLSIKGEDRPTMKVVAMELEGLRIMEKHSHGKSDLYREQTECSLNAITSYLSLDDGIANPSTSTTIDSMGDQVPKSTIVCR
ncbi:hypothetical protein CIPAW_16G020000 [Carya illinoinensis]|uniref:Wall-associated receptor kinase 2-like n=2 Tax=Carya illinoinensis TaxID=32201 RepID=A0A8T1N2V6_CARIL|nr:hypothetical protein CIPAW_16G020000 [Carya illinoinensis]